MYVAPTFYEGGIPFDGELLNILLDELVADGAFVRRDDGYVALPNWSDFRFDFNI